LSRSLVARPGPGSPAIAHGPQLSCGSPRCQPAGVGGRLTITCEARQAPSSRVAPMTSSLSPWKPSALRRRTPRAFWPGGRVPFSPRPSLAWNSVPTCCSSTPVAWTIPGRQDSPSILARQRASRRWESLSGCWSRRAPRPSFDEARWHLSTSMVAAWAIGCAREQTLGRLLRTPVGAQVPRRLRTQSSPRPRQPPARRFHSKRRAASPGRLVPWLQLAEKSQ
jgi:hypothetical protein